jgi:hypothetical protein
MSKTLIDDYEAISAVVQLYIDGSAKGDGAKLRAAFHPDARMYGQAGGRRVDLPIEKFIAMAEKGPMDVNGSYRGRLVSVEQVGGAAVATLAEDGCWGTVSFVDYFALSRIEGTWKIVNKIFEHTGGTMPGS